MFKRPQHHAATSRSGFTLVELMMVVGLVLLIAVMTASAINLSINGDKVRGGARQVQSYLAGARDRAIYSKAPRGVRFLLTNNPTDPLNPTSRTVSSMVYIAPTDDWTQGTIQMEWDSSDPTAQVLVVRGFDNFSPSTAIINPTGWLGLYNQGLLKDGLRIKIPNDNTGEWYTISTSLMASASPDQSDGPNPPKLVLTTPYARPGTTDPVTTVPAFQAGQGPPSYRLELPASVLPNQEPVLLPKGCVIHLDRCGTFVEQVNAGTFASGRGNKLPSAWRKPSTTTPKDTSGFDYTSMMDVMFSPRGVVTGPAAQTGIIHFYIADEKDAELDRMYWKTASSYPTVSAPEYGTWTDPSAISPGYERGDKLILTLFTRTGAVSTHPIHPTDTFKFAETGEVAGK